MPCSGILPGATKAGDAPNAGERAAKASELMEGGAAQTGLPGQSMAVAWRPPQADWASTVHNDGA
jgi:hypothetical protein